MSIIAVVKTIPGRIFGPRTRWITIGAIVILLGGAGAEMYRARMQSMPIPVIVSPKPRPRAAQVPKPQPAPQQPTVPVVEAPLPPKPVQRQVAKQPVPVQQPAQAQEPVEKPAEKQGEKPAAAVRVEPPLCRQDIRGITLNSSLDGRYAYLVVPEGIIVKITSLKDFTATNSDGTTYSLFPSKLYILPNTGSWQLEANAGDSQ